MEMGIDLPLSFDRILLLLYADQFKILSLALALNFDCLLIMLKF